MNFTQQILTCCNKKHYDYTVTYDREPKTTMNVCDSCWNESRQFKKDDTTTKSIHVFQLRVLEIICNKCKNDVTSTIGCNSCHPNSQEESR
jgi:hypothetical protein